jgi:hypothetical protein
VLNLEANHGISRAALRRVCGGTRNFRRPTVTPSG